MPLLVPKIVPTHNIGLFLTRLCISNPDLFIYKLLNLHLSTVISNDSSWKIYKSWLLFNNGWLKISFWNNTSLESHIKI